MDEFLNDHKIDNREKGSDKYVSLLAFINITFLILCTARLYLAKVKLRTYKPRMMMYI